VVLEFGNGGQDLEHVTLNNAAQGMAVFHQVAHAFAVAENCFEFEHRDLHGGNILVRECSEKFQQYILDGQTLKVESQSVCVTIIDFSLSWMKSPKDGCRIFNNLAKDEELFVAQGDYQFEIYRLMRDHTGNEWQGFYPKTNIVSSVKFLDKISKNFKWSLPHAELTS
jgi:serine/threonine-protein kinase haspin